MDNIQFLPFLTTDVNNLRKSVFVEGGAETARRFLEAGLVDRIRLFTSDVVVGEGGIVSPLSEANIPEGFTLLDMRRFGGDRLVDYERPF